VDYISSGIIFDFIARQSSSSQVVIASTSSIVYNYPTNFNFQISNLNSLPKYSTIVIYLSTTIVASDELICMYGSLTIACTYNVATNSIATSFLSSNVFAVGSLGGQSLQLQNLYNPPSTKLSSSFLINIQNSIGNTI